MGSNHASGGEMGSLSEEATGWAVATLGLALTGLGPVYYVTAPDPVVLVTAVGSLPDDRALARRTPALGRAGPPAPVLRWTLLGGVLGGPVGDGSQSAEARRTTG